MILEKIRKKIDRIIEKEKNKSKELHREIRTNETKKDKYKKILKEIKKIELKFKRPVYGLLVGEYHSAFKGNGVEFTDLREYIYGDDVRNIDWNVTARMNKPYVKEFIEERHANIYFMVDFSGSMSFGSTISKLDLVTKIIAYIANSAIKNNDNIGLILANENIIKFIKAKSSNRQMYIIINNILTTEPNKRLSKRISSKVLNLIKKKSIIFFISDFLDDKQLYKDILLRLKQKHDILAIIVRDKNEIFLENVGYIYLQDTETGQYLLIDTSDKELIKKYNELMKKDLEKCKNLLKTLGISHMLITNTTNIYKELVKFFSIKSKNQ